VKGFVKKLLTDAPSWANLFTNKNAGYYPAFLLVAL